MSIPTYIGYCCREWVLALGGRGSCGICGERPEFVRPDVDNPDYPAEETA